MTRCDGFQTGTSRVGTAFIGAVRECQLRGSEVKRGSHAQWCCGKVLNADVVTRTRRVWAMLIGDDEIKLSGGVLEPG